jgi:hypothetical protein
MHVRTCSPCSSRWCALALFALTTCSDDGGGPTRVDHRVAQNDATADAAVADQQPPADTASVDTLTVDISHGDGPLGDTTKTDQSKGDLPVFATDGNSSACEPACQATDVTYCVTNPSTGKCVDCLTDNHCKMNPTAIGASCDAGYCSCTSDAECKGNAFGAKCITFYFECGCASDADCAGSIFGPTCDTYLESCSCSSDADCKVPPYTVCATGVFSSIKTCSKP